MNKLDLNVSKDYKMNNLQDLDFCELINVKKLEYLLANEKYYDEYFTEERNKLKIKFKESKHEYNVFALIKKFIKNIIKIDNSDYGYLPVSYKKADGINYGRWYAKKSIGLQSILGYIRHTICENKWNDIDQVNSHPTILHQLFAIHGIDCDALNYLIFNREEFLKSIMDELGISRGEAKTIIIAVINGGSTYKSKIVADFKDKVFEHIKTICLLPEFNYILEDCLKKEDKEKTFNLYGKCISRILQVIENDLLEHYVKFFVDRGLIPKIILNGKEYYFVSLIFDGLQIPYHPDIVSNDTILKECQAYAFEHTGYNVDLIVKPFDNALELPDDFQDVLDDIPAIINNLRTGLEHFKNKNRKIIDKAVDTLTHYDTAVIFGIMLKDKVYCEDDKNWYYCNPYNIWKYNSSPIILDAIMPVIGPELLELISKEYVSKAMDTTLEKEEKDKNLKEAEKVNKLMNNIKLTPYRNSVIKGNYSLYIKENFKEKYLDSNTHLFAFSNKVFDFSLKKENPTINDFIRYIKPNDYILTNTGYNFPERFDDAYKTKLNQYFDDLFPVIEIQDDDDDKIITLNQGKKDFVLNIIATSLNGANNEQSVFFHTGRGSNSKTTLFALIEKVFGDYFISLNSETFTEKMRANACNDLWKLKGKRFTTFQEPDDTNGTELQASTLKVFGDNASVKLKGNQKYKDPIDFVNQSTLHGAMNKKPSLSGVDGGIKRRVKIIEYTTQFVDNPTDDNYEKKIDPDFMKLISQDNMRDAFVIMLLENWIENVKDLKIITVPDCVIEASKEYCDSCDVVKQFLDDEYKITRDVKDRIKSSDIYAKFKQYIKTNGIEKSLSDKKFKESILDIRGIIFKKMKDGNYYCGLKEKEENEQPVINQGPTVDTLDQIRNIIKKERKKDDSEDEGYSSSEPYVPM